MRLEEANGSEILKHNPFDKNWTPEEKMELISKVLAGNSNQSVALEAGINSGMLYQWVRKYKTEGYNGLVNMKKGRPCKEHSMRNNAKEDMSVYVKSIQVTPILSKEIQGIL